MLHGAVPNMVTATISLLLMTLVAVTSVRAARNAMGYERWHLVHLTAYAAVLLSLPHQLSTGTDIAGHPMERGVLARPLPVHGHAACCGGACWCPSAVPFGTRRTSRPWCRNRLACGRSGSAVAGWTGSERRPVSTSPGAFLARGMLLAGHPWSLSAAPDRHRLRITVRELGDHSSRLPDLRPGTRVLIEGPYGAFTAERRVRRRVTLLAARDRHHSGPRPGRRAHHRAQQPAGRDHAGLSR